MKLVIVLSGIVICLLIVTASYFLVTSQSESNDPARAHSPISTHDNQSSETAAGQTELDNTADNPATAEHDTQDATDPAPEKPVSPFDVVNTENTSTGHSETDISNADSEVPSAGNNEQAQRNTPQNRVVVPDSYPVTDAEKYFVPKDQRGPGNLGGPPPLNFPGGPSDPNLPALDGNGTSPAVPDQ